MIPARYEASRFPGKLLKDLAGQSVIMRTYEQTLNTQLFDAVYVVTDSDIIAHEVLTHNGKVIRNKREHQTGSDRIAEAAHGINADLIINVQGDEPFVNKVILQQIIEEFKNDTTQAIDVVSLVFSIDNIEDINNPNNVKVVLDQNNNALYFSRAPIPYPRENTTAQYYQHIGIYGFRKEALERFSQLPMEMLEQTEKLENLRFLSYGMTVRMLKTKHKSIGIDTPEDLEKARKLIQNTNL